MVGVFGGIVLTLVVSLVFLGAYYVIGFRSNELLQSLATKAFAEL